MLRYCRGDQVSDVFDVLPRAIRAWEVSRNFIGPDQADKKTRWADDIDHYIFAFWMVGLALAAQVDAATWQRLIFLVANEGEDLLLDRMIATRSGNRRIGEALLYPKVYQRLLNSMEPSSPDRQSAELARFVNAWYSSLARPGKNARGVRTGPPSWYRFNQIRGGYFGFWCVEAVAVVKAFGIDDELCRGNSNYPGDLLIVGQ